MVNSNIVAICGVDGSGKSTVLKRLAWVMQGEGFQFRLTKEPGGPRALATEWGVSPLTYPFGAYYDSFREMCINDPSIPQLVRRGIYQADSFYNYLKVLKPCMEQGITVVSDRSWLSDLAYGAALGAASMEDLYQFNVALIPNRPNFTRVVYLKASREVREARLSASMADHADKIGAEARDRVCAVYEQALEKYIYDYTVIDADQSVKEIVIQVKEFVYNGCTK